MWKTSLHVLSECAEQEWVAHILFARGVAKVLLREISRQFLIFLRVCTLGSANLLVDKYFKLLHIRTNQQKQTRYRY
jgi:hypothetical protein